MYTKGLFFTLVTLKAAGISSICSLYNWSETLVKFRAAPGCWKVNLCADEHTKLVLLINYSIKFLQQINRRVGDTVP